MKKNYNVMDAILAIRPGTVAVVRGNDTDSIEYLDVPGGEPTEAELDAAGAALDVKMKEIDGLLSKKFNMMLANKYLELDNRVRVLEGRGAMTFYNLKQQFKAELP